MIEMSATHLYSDNFEKVISSSQTPAVVDFWASWCNPCRMLAPVIEDLSDVLDGKAGVYKLDVDEAGDVAAAYGVMSIPTIIIFVGGTEKERIVGFRSKEDLLKIVEKYL